MRVAAIAVYRAYEMDNGPTWEQYFHGIAAAVSLRATCPRASVGAVIVSEGHRILSTGYNGAPPGEAHCLDVGCRIEDMRRQPVH